jgi:hypothetical protein
MPVKKYTIVLTAAERTRLESVAQSYRHSARERNRAKVLLLADAAPQSPGLGDAQIAAQVGCAATTVSEIRQRAAERGVLEVLQHKEQVHRKPRRLDGAGEAQLVAIGGNCL